MEGELALVLGATGGIGGAVTRRLKASGWRVRAFSRRPGVAKPPEGCESITGNALNAAAVARAAEGAALIVHAVSPPGYRNWEKLVLPMLDNTIAAARSAGARIVLPGTVYNYGPDAFPLIAEEAPQHPVTRKGAIRALMEQRLHAAAEASLCKVLIVRAGDFFGPQAGNNWFSQAVIKPGKLPRRIYNPGQAGVGHQWAYLPDVAETMVQLIEKGGLADFAAYHMEGHWDEDGTGMTQTIVRVLGAPAVRVTPLPWWALRIASPFSTTLHELMELAYLWNRPVRLVNEKLRAQLGVEPHTPLELAVRTTLVAMGCLETERL
ncbi:MAG: NAD-dependent epimerase/dehydratase family protein [Alphaproteobacteria bacterium]|nr:NAD-dependent epimerase/dehydratase family protein [Alphaproteobacteria bacterium]